MTQKTRNILGWVLAIIVGLLMIFTGVMKLSGSDEAMKGAAKFGVSASTIKMLGIVEIISALLFLIPRTGILGTLLLAAYLGGAIATHVQHQLPLTMPVVCEALVWITAVIRFPELTQRIMNSGAIGMRR